MKYQLVCPKCKHEFAYDNGELDKRITELGLEINSIELQIAQYNALPPGEKKKREDWKKRAAISRLQKTQEIKRLKAYRKVADQQRKHAELTLFQNLIKETYGDEVFREMLEKVQAEMEAYQTSGLMWHEYSRANGQSITSINKL